MILAPPLPHENVTNPSDDPYFHRTPDYEQFERKMRYSHNPWSSAHTDAWLPLKMRAAEASLNLFKGNLVGAVRSLFQPSEKLREIATTMLFIAAQENRPSAFTSLARIADGNAVDKNGNTLMHIHISGETPDFDNIDLAKKMLKKTCSGAALDPEKDSDIFTILIGTKILPDELGPKANWDEVIVCDSLSDNNSRPNNEGFTPLGSLLISTDCEKPSYNYMGMSMEKKRLVLLDYMTPFDRNRAPSMIEKILKNGDPSRSKVFSLTNICFSVLRSEDVAKQLAQKAIHKERAGDMSSDSCRNFLREAALGCLCLRSNEDLSKIPDLELKVKGNPVLRQISDSNAIHLCPEEFKPLIERVFGLKNKSQSSDGVKLMVESIGHEELTNVLAAPLAKHPNTEPVPMESGSSHTTVTEPHTQRNKTPLS